MKNAERILIVDDMAKNRDVLEGMMTVLGYTSILAEHGLDALAKIQERLPDLVLLDILMPKMDGYQVLKHLKSDSALLDIPVIMISAVDEMKSVVRCIELGADDYLIKPFNPTLLKARIHASLDKKRLRDQEKVYQKMIEDHNRNLEEQVRQKSQELAEAHDKLKILDKAKSDFLELISHEMRTPLNGIFGSAELLFAENMDDEARAELQDVFRTSSQRLLDILDEALLITRIEVSAQTFPVEPTAMRDVLAFAGDASSSFAASRQVTLGQTPPCETLVFGEKELLTTALSALFKTAVKLSHPETCIHLSCESRDGNVFIEISATGHTIPADALSKFFDVFSIAEPITQGGDLGLAPAVAERILKLFDGSVSVKNRESDGVVLTVRLKSAEMALSQDGIFRVYAH